MKIQERITSIANDQAITELQELLKSPEEGGSKKQVSISWNGKRVVSIASFEDVVEIDQLARKFLSAPPFNWQKKASFKMRLDCNRLWDKIENLYLDSENLLNQTFFYKYIVWCKEFDAECACCSGNPRKLLQEWDGGSTRRSIFSFSKEEFKAYWPDRKPVGGSTFFQNGITINLLNASEDMVESYIAKKS